MKKILLLSILVFTTFFFLDVLAANRAPEFNCIWLPWCTDTVIEDPWMPAENLSWNVVFWITTRLIILLIKYVAVIAVISIIISWIMYLISMWDEEKAKKAKNWIIWSLVWVFVSISAWWIINMINNIEII